jgi:hypothetical protein
MPRQLNETFIVDGPSGALIRRVIPKRGKPYEHMCTKQVYDDVAYTIEQMGNASFTMEDIRAKIGDDSVVNTGSNDDDSNMPSWTQVAVAIAFLKERSCIVPARNRKHVAATNYLYEDALIEYHALREKGPEDATAPNE